MNELKQKMNGNENKQRKINPVTTKEVCGMTICQIKERLSYRGHFEARVQLIQTIFPNITRCLALTFKSIVVYYPVLQQHKLRTEVEVIYSRKNFRYIVGDLNMLSLLPSNCLMIPLVKP